MPENSLIDSGEVWTFIGSGVTLASVATEFKVSEKLAQQVLDQLRGLGSAKLDGGLYRQHKYPA